MVRCCVKKCRSDSTKSAVRFHSFPKNNDFFKRWIAKTDLFHKINQITPYNYFKVCRRHFNHSDYVSEKHLKKGSVPSLNLPLPSFMLDHDYCSRGSIEDADGECISNATSETKDGTSTNLGRFESLKSDDFPVNISNELCEESNFVTQPEFGSEQGQTTSKQNSVDNLTQHFEEAISSPLSDSSETNPKPNSSSGAFMLDHDYCSRGSIEDADGECISNPTSETKDGTSTNLGSFESLKSDDFPVNISNELCEESNFVTQPDFGSEQGQTTSKQNSVDNLTQQFEESISSLLSDSSEVNAIPNPPSGAVVDVYLKQNQKPSRLYNSAARKQRYHESKVRSLKLQVKALKCKDNNPFWNNAKKKMSKAQAEFVEMQIRNPSKSKNGKRFNLKEKSMCLAMYKKGPKSYRSFAEVFSLPTKQTLTKHASCAHFQPGINENVMKFMKETVSKMTEKERMCCLSWDEISLAPELNHSKSDDCIEGFVDVGLYRVKSFTNHALTFMVRGIMKPFKQSVAYFLTKPGTTGSDLAELIISVIEAVVETGLNVVLSVCDQIAINITAINYLLSQGSSLKKNSNSQLIQYTIKNTLITHIYDPCHLLKGIRNNLLTKNLTHFVSEDDISSEQNRIASWNDVQNFYKLYQKSSSQLLSKITDEHIHPKQLKMKVSVAAEIFSRTFGKTMRNYSFSNQSKKDFTATADILIFFNDIFDSMNGAGDAIQDSIKGSISNLSGHLFYWRNVIPAIEKMEWVIKEKDEEEKKRMKQKNESTEPTTKRKTRKEPQAGDVCRRSKVLPNVISTLKGLIFITDQLLSQGIEIFSPRRFNSDGLENYFGDAKGVCLATRSPTPRQFKSAFSTIFFYNSPSLHSSGANCEKDGDVPLLESMELFFIVNQTPIKSDFSCNFITY